ncbi:hypothetical protein M0805_002865 [Coniferiporia weirii]|nr:hypothetical protein M0805_002865 [Coniferiporia weirii]
MSQSQKHRSATGHHALLPASNSKGEDAFTAFVPSRDMVAWTFGRGTALWTIWPAVLLHTAFAAAVTTISLTTRIYLAVPPVLINVLGVVIGFVISYRASSGYDRYWMGRCCWSDLIKNSRTMSRLIWIHVPLLTQKGPSSNEAIIVRKIMREKRLALDLIEGFVVATKHHLRGEMGIYYEDLYPLVKPLHDHPNHIRRPHLARHAHRQDNAILKSQAPTRVHSIASPASSTRPLPALFVDPKIPAINEYGTFRPSSASSSSSDCGPESIGPFLLPSAPVPAARSRILTELVPFSSFFSSLKDTLWPWNTKHVGYTLHAGVEADKRTTVRNFRGHGKKFRPAVAGGGQNVPLEILQCLSDWVNVLDERGVVPGNPLGGLYSCISAFEDSLSALERILTTPLPFIYSAHIRQCVWTYLFLLPFQLVTQFGWYTIPGVGIAAFFYIGFLAAGEEIEQPFGYDDNDLDLDLFCREIVHANIEALKLTRCLNVYFADDDQDPDMSQGQDHGSALCIRRRKTGIERIAEDS